MLDEIISSWYFDDAFKTYYEQHIEQYEIYDIDNIYEHDLKEILLSIYTTTDMEKKKKYTEQFINWFINKKEGWKLCTKFTFYLGKKNYDIYCKYNSSLSLQCRDKEEGLIRIYIPNKIFLLLRVTINEENKLMLNDGPMF